MNEFTLPNGVLFDGVLYNKAHLEDLTGKQQNYLVNTKYKSPVDHVERLLGDLLVDLRDESNQSIKNKAAIPHVICQLMQIEDVQFLLVKLREISYGPRYFFEQLKCPHCSAKNNAEVNLEDLQVIHPTKARLAKYILPKSGMEIEYRPMNLSELKSFGADSERLLNNHVTETMLTILKRIGENTNIKLEDVEGLKAIDNEFIADNSPEYSHLDTKITHQCTACKKDFDFDLGEMSADFFALSRT